MGWLRKRLGESSSFAALGGLLQVIKPLVNPAYHGAVDIASVLLCGGGIVKPEAGNK